MTERPQVTKTTHILPFDKLSPADFERLCLWLVQREGYEDAEHFGTKGSDHGRDVVAWLDGRRVVFQCKRVERFEPAEAEKEIAKVLELPAETRPQDVVFLVTATVTAETRDRASAAWGDRGSCHFWAGTELDERVNRHEDILGEFFGVSRSGEERAALRDYLNSVWSRLLPVPMMATSTVASRRQEIPLCSVYTALDVTATVIVGPWDYESSQHGPVMAETELGGDAEYLEALVERACEEAEEVEEANFEGYVRTCTALEAAAAASRLVLLGPAGSGKSTFVRYLALSLAGEALGKAEANLNLLNAGSEDAGGDPATRPWPHGASLPLYVELKDFSRSPAFPAEGQTGDATHLLRFIDTAVSPSSAELLRTAFGAEDRALVILDGLDEIPAAEENRRRLKDVVASFTQRYPKCRLLVTSRPYTYASGSAWRLDEWGFEEANLSPFDEEQSHAFIEAWYRHLASRQQIGADEAEKGSRDLWREITSRSYLKPLAELPLMLTMMVDLHASGGGRLRGGRAALYERSVELLLDRWNETYGKSAADDLGMPVEAIRRALEGLAYKVHRERGGDSRSEFSEITETELWHALGRERPQRRLVDEREVMRYLHERSGILLAESPTRFRFPHRSYQEYLAACHLVRENFPSLFHREVKANPAPWREVVQLAVGKVAETPFMAWVLLEGLVPQEPVADANQEDLRFLLAFYAALAVMENELQVNVQEQDASKLERIRRWLERSLEIGALSPIDRAAGGRVLSVLGDQRPGVSLTEEGDPDIDWVEIPAGPFLMGSGPAVQGLLWPKGTYGQDEIEVELAEFRISRFPVTNAQFSAFVADGGYGKKWKHCWTPAGWQWKGRREGPDDDLATDSLLGNHPRVNVTWYEAVAFSKWLGEKLGLEVVLPTEAQWEKSAKGSESRLYPWGEFKTARCNIRRTGIGRTCAVGSFPDGSSPYGVLDLSGNVWEWCSSRWRTEPATQELTRETGRVLRGGSFSSEELYASCAFRIKMRPDVVDRRDIGFRVSAPI